MTSGRLPPTVPLAVWLGLAVLLLAAVGPWPYGFYMLLRLAVCAGSVFVALRLGSTTPLMWAFVVLAILYNPIFRVSFEREVWSIINVVSSIPFLMVGYQQWRARPQKS